MSTTTYLDNKNSHAALDALAATWVNAVADDIEALFAGYLALSVGGSADVTLTEAQAANPVLVFTGILTGNISVIVPDWPKQWLVFNNTSGAYTLTVKTTAGTGIAITQAYRAIVYGDATNVYRFTPDFNGTVVIASTIGPNATQQHTVPAVASDTFGLIAAAQTLTNKTLTSPKVGTSVLDTNGNELLLLTATASAVNELTLSNGATGVGPILEASGETNVDATFRGKGSGGVQLSRSGGKLGFFGVTLAARAAALTQTYSTADRTLSAYTSDPESTPYTGIDNAQGATPYATVADLNALRTAYENLRAFTEDLAAFTNALIDDLQLYGLEQ